MITMYSCAGCHTIITDRYLLAALDLKWHIQCLRCCICFQSLDGENSCYCKEGNVYCKFDYYKLYGHPHNIPSRSCSRCQLIIFPNELVMRVRGDHIVYHLNCFTCYTCATPLNPGDRFGMIENQLFCGFHYPLMLGQVQIKQQIEVENCENEQSANKTSMAVEADDSKDQVIVHVASKGKSKKRKSSLISNNGEDPNNSSQVEKKSGHVKKSQNTGTNYEKTNEPKVNDLDESYLEHKETASPGSSNAIPAINKPQTPERSFYGAVSGPASCSNNLIPSLDYNRATLSLETLNNHINSDIPPLKTSHFSNNARGLIRTNTIEHRSCDSVNHANYHDMDNNIIPCPDISSATKSRNYPIKDIPPECESYEEEMGVIEGRTCLTPQGFYPHPLMGMPHPLHMGPVPHHMHHHMRNKRLRTSFKHNQLKTMKTYFALNHNPDAKDLKQLSQKTGLSKRVLQVWFQNARAKYRRSMSKQETGGGNYNASVGTNSNAGNEDEDECQFRDGCQVAEDSLDYMAEPGSIGEEEEMHSKINDSGSNSPQNCVLYPYDHRLNSSPRANGLQDNVMDNESPGTTTQFYTLNRSLSSGMRETWG